LAIKSPLRICADNPQYFENGANEVVYLTGAHTWNGLVDMGPKGRVTPFDWADYLAFLNQNDHNFVRLWAWNSLGTWNPADEVLTTPWKRTGPGNAVDGGPRLDLEELDQDYFNRLASRLAAARESGVYVSIMMFECWSNFTQNEAPVSNHMFAGGNNINDIDILRSPFRGVHAAWCTLQDPKVLAIQKAYVRKVVETANPFENVLYEICNEGGVQSHAWQEYLIGYIRELESGMPLQHPIGQTGGMGTSNRQMHESSADWVAPDGSPTGASAQGYRTGHYTYGQGPDEAARCPVILDTDHLWGVGGRSDWAWKSFCRGYNPIYMDPRPDPPSGFFVHPRWPSPSDPGLRRELGAIRRLAAKLDLRQARPCNDIASSGYCIGVRGAQYIAFQPSARPVSLDLSAGTWRVTWHDPEGGTTEPPVSRLLSAPGTWEFAPPFDGPSALLVEAVSG